MANSNGTRVEGRLNNGRFTSVQTILKNPSAGQIVIVPNRK